LQFTKSTTKHLLLRTQQQCRVAQLVPQFRQRPPTHSLPSMTLRLDNSLSRAENATFLFVSAWATTPDETMRYDNCHFVPAMPLRLNSALPPIAVRCDMATLTFMRTRKYAYEWEQYKHDASGQWRVRITAMLIDESSGDTTRVTLPFDEFLPRYQSDSRYHTYADELVDSDDDDDDEEDEEETKQPARRRIE
jgi:hypothetical protein